MPGCDKRCYILPAEPAYTKQDGNAGAQMQVAQILRFSLEAPQFVGIKNQPTNQKETQTRLRFLNTIASTSLCRTRFLTAKNKTAFALVVSFSHFHCLQPLQELRRGGNAEIVETGLV